MSDLGEYFICVKIHRHPNGNIKVAQIAHVKNLLEKFSLNTCRPAKTVIIKPGTLGEPSEEISNIHPDY